VAVRRLIKFLVLYLVCDSVLAQATVELVPAVIDFDYQEQARSGASLNREHGLLRGGTLSLTWRDETFGFLASVSRSTGRVAYEGNTQIGLPLFSESDERVRDFGVGVDYTILSSTRLFSRIYQHRWNRSILPTQSTLSLVELYDWRRVELGLAATFPVTALCSEFLFEAAYLKISHAGVRVDLASLGYGRPTLELGRTEGWRVAWQSRFAITSQIDWLIGVEHIRFGFGESAPKRLSKGASTIVLYEPESITELTQLKLGLSLSL